MRNSVVILVLLVFLSCSSTKNLTDKDLIGKYQAKSYYEGYSIIDLKKDKTFEYIWKTSSLIGGTTYGTWKKDGNKIILNSEFQKDYEITRTDNKQSDSITVKTISATDNLPLPSVRCILKLNKKTVNTISANFDGIAVFPKVEADSLEVSFTGLKTIQHKLDKDITYYEFKMRDDDFYEYFTEAVWIYKNRKLYNSKRKKYIKF